MTAINSQRMQSVDSSVDSREAYAHRTNDEIIPKWSTMMSYKREHKNNMNWPQILDHPYRILIIRGSGSW